MNVESELKDIINRLYDIQDVSGPDLSKKIYEIILQCREAIGYRKAELDRVQSSRKPINSGFAQRNAGMIMDKLDQCDNIVKTCISISPDSRLTEELNELEDKIDDVATHAEMLSNGDEKINSSKKPIKSFRNTSTEDTSNNYGFYWEGDYIYDKDGIHWYFGDYINGNTGIEPYSSYIQAVKETEDNIRDSFTEDEIPDPEDYAYQLIDFAVETLPDPGKYIREYEGFVKSSRKPIKSSLEDRLVPYLEEFEEGLADTQIVAPGDEMDIPSREETFFEVFKSDHNLTDDDIKALKDTVYGIWEASAGE